ncbi:MAG: hypothetical protein H6546_07010 [Chitinophagales bacterium]|nr:hypothetical protein [Chitinophagales bacterium]
MNSAGIFSNELLQSIGNVVRTTILADPGVNAVKYSNRDYVPAGQSFEWRIEYNNKSSNDADYVVLSEHLPANVVLESISHSWNSIADANGAPNSDGDGGTVEVYDISSHPGVSIIPQTDGTTDVQIMITEGTNGLR